MRGSAGFTLIELMIGITIMALLLLAAAPFTQNWVDGNRQMRARSNLVEAVSQARALAMRNPRALDLARAAQGVAAVVYDKDTFQLCVVRRNSAGTAWDDCAAAEWRGTITEPAGLRLASGAGPGAPDFLCAAFDSRGLLVASTLGDASCTGPATGAATQVTITVGSQEAVNVALL